MRRLLFAALFAIGFTCSALAQTSPTYWYWQVIDTSPTTEVWEATSGSFVSNTSTNFKAWLTAVAANPTAGGFGLALTISNATNNGSGAIRLTILNPSSGMSGWATGQIKTVTGVGGVTAANGAWAITVVDPIGGVVDLQGSVFSGTYTSGGVIGSGSLMDTAAHMNAAINNYNLSVALAGAGWGLNNSITATTTLTNPMAFFQNVAMGSGSQSISMPQANLFGSIPIGFQITFLNSSLTNSFQVKDFSGNLIVTVPVGYMATMILASNGSANGVYYAALSFVSALNCASLSNSASYCSAAVGQLPGTTTNDNATSGNVGEYLSASCPGSASTATVTITIASPGVITWTTHGIIGACPVVFTTSSALPTGITAGTTYWVVPSSITTNTFQIATSAANALSSTPVNTSGTQSGNQTGTAGAPLSTTTPKNIAGLSLTAGDWDCRASLARTLAASTSVTLLKSSLNTTSATDGSIPAGTMDQYATAANVAANDITRVIGPVRVSLSGAGNVYLVADDTFTVSTNIGYGFLACRRAR